MAQRLRLAAMVDASRDLTIALEAYPLMVFDVEPTYPSSAYPGQIVSITFAWRNTGGVGTGFWRIRDLDTGSVIASDEFPVGIGQADWVTVNLTMPSKDWNLRLELGHIE